MCAQAAQCNVVHHVHRSHFGSSTFSALLSSPHWAVGAYSARPCQWPQWPCLRSSRVRGRSFRRHCLVFNIVEGRCSCNNGLALSHGRFSRGSCVPTSRSRASRTVRALSRTLLRTCARRRYHDFAHGRWQELLGTRGALTTSMLCESAQVEGDPGVDVQLLSFSLEWCLAHRQFAGSVGLWPSGC